MGAVSYKQSKKEELAFAIVASFIEDSYYESKDKRIKRIATLVAEIAKDDPLFVAKLAIVTRREFHMRSAFHVLLSELSRSHKKTSLVKNTLKEGVERPDDLLEIASYVKRPLPNQIKKGIALAIHKFDPYQLAKYRGEGKDFSMVDLFNLVRPKPVNDKESALFKQLIKGELKQTDTWESKLSSEEGRKDKGATWKTLVMSGKLGYMALLRNLRNIATNCDTETVTKAAEIIADPEQVKKSKQLPFRFLSAYEALTGKPGEKIAFEKDVDNFALLQKAIEKAVTGSIENLPDLLGRTVILTDNSGSMRGDAGGGSLVSAYSKRTTASIANLFAAMYWLKAENTYVGVFGDRLEQPKLDRTKSLFENYKVIDRVGAGIGGGTEHGAFECFRNLIEAKTKVDRVVMFTDCQLGEGWYGEGSWRSDGPESQGSFNKLYKQFKAINPEAKVYCVDLKGHGNTLFSDGAFCLSGWSDKIFDLMEMIEKKEGFVKWVEQYPVQLTQ